MFSFEDTIEKIPETKTKEYFREVYSSYTAGNYRSAIVMLWTVVICDIVFKLQYLKDVYSDETAISILDEIENIQNKAPNSSEWEMKLVVMIFERTSFLSHADKLHIEHLQKNRHLCAHPVIINNNTSLFQPTKEKTRDMLRGALEGILIKPALLTKSIVKNLISDLAEKRQRLSDYDNIKTYLNSKYFNNVEKETVVAIFRALWKFSINARLDDEKNNQDINFLALRVLLEKYKLFCLNEIENDSEKYSRDIIEAGDTGLDNAVELLTYFNELYLPLSDNAKTRIKDYIMNKREGEDYPLDRFLSAVFLSDNVEKHFEKIISNLDNDCVSERIDINNVENLCHMAEEADILDMFYLMCAKIYARSGSYKAAWRLFTVCVKPYVHLFSKDILLFLIEESQKNKQTYGRRYVESEHMIVLKQFIEKGGKEEEIEECYNWHHLLQKHLKYQLDIRDVSIT